MNEHRATKHVFQVNEVLEISDVIEKENRLDSGQKYIEFCVDEERER